MMNGNIIREQGLNIDEDPSAVLQNPDTLGEYREQFFKIFIPQDPIFTGLVVQPKIIGR